MNVERLEDRRPPQGTPAGNGTGAGGGSNTGERLARLETEVGHLATKADLQQTENSLIKWMLGTICVCALTLVVAVLRTFMT